MPALSVRHGSVMSTVPVMSVMVDGDPNPVTLYTTPPDGTFTPGFWVVQEVERPGFKPLAYPKAPGLRSYSFEHKVWDPKPSGGIDAELKALAALAERGKKVKFLGTTALAMDTWYWVKECKITIEEKGAGNQARMATVSWGVTEAVMVNPVDWSKTKAQGQPPIRLEALDPAKDKKDEKTVKNDSESGKPDGGGNG